MLLNFGSRGEDVKKLQSKLNLEPDGIFGRITEQTVKNWQIKNKLSATGVIDDNQWEILFNINSYVTDNKTFIKLDKLKGYVPDFVLEQLTYVMPKFNITNILRLSHFLAQCAHESGNFKAVTENLNYSEEGLKKIFPKYFPGNLAASYARNPQKIGSRVYGNRMGNGNESTGEGFKFRGRGYIQLTGKNNYKGFSNFIGEDAVLNPDIISTKYPLASAAYFFNSNNLWSSCDKGSSVDVITEVTRRVNGGVTGLSERIIYFNKFWGILK